MIHIAHNKTSTSLLTVMKSPLLDDALRRWFSCLLSYEHFPLLLGPFGSLHNHGDVEVVIEQEEKEKLNYEVCSRKGSQVQRITFTTTITFYHALVNTIPCR